jgi:hypothetical protein
MKPPGLDGGNMQEEVDVIWIGQGLSNPAEAAVFLRNLSHWSFWLELRPTIHFPRAS